MPPNRGSAPIVHVPVAELQSIAEPTPNAQQLEITLRERLQQQRRNSILLNNPLQQERSITAGNLPTPPSTTHSDRFSSIDVMETPVIRNGSDQMICDDTIMSEERSTDRIMPMKTPEPRDRTIDMQKPDTQAPVLSNTRRRGYSRSTSESRSRSPSRTRVNPKQSGSITRGRAYRSPSRSISPLGSLRRNRTNSPVSRRSRSIGSEENRGRRMGSIELPRSPPSNRSIRDRPQSPQSRSRSNGRDSYMRSRPMSTSTTLYSDELAVERASSTQYSSSPSPSPTRVHRPSDFSGEPGPIRGEVSKAEIKPSLQLRISDGNPSPIRGSPKHSRRRTCPFYHPTEQDKHPLDGPHPGYSIKEFDEAVNCYEQGGTLPGRLIKEGVTINPKNRPLRSPTKSMPRRSQPFQTSHLPLEQRVDGCVATLSRSRSPMEPATKRRKIIPQSFPPTSGPFMERGYSTYSSQPKGTTSQNVAPFRRGPSSSPYEIKRQPDYFQHSGVGGSPTLTRPHKPAYGRRLYSQPNMGYYRAQ